MTTRHKGLGRGLDALLGGAPRSRGEEELAQLPVGVLRPGKYQPRTRMDEASLAELADSIRSRGVIQPIVVRPVGDSQYEILAGERRWRAARIANLERIPAVIREVPDEAALGIGLIENIQREDLNPIEEASGLKRLVDEGILERVRYSERGERCEYHLTPKGRDLKLVDRELVTHRRRRAGRPGAPARCRAGARRTRPRR